MLQVAERAAAAATRSQSHPQAITMQRSSEVVQHGSFASIPPICRQREKKRKMPLALTPAFLRPQSRLVWLAVRAHQGTVSGTSRRLFRNRESEISSRLRWPGRLCHHLSRSPSLPLSLLNLLPPFRAPSLPPSQSTAFCQRPSGDPQISAHTHPQTWKCILLLRNYSHHWTL